MATLDQALEIATVEREIEVLQERLANRLEVRKKLYAVAGVDADGTEALDIQVKGTPVKVETVVKG